VGVPLVPGSILYALPNLSKVNAPRSLTVLPTARVAPRDG